MPLTNHRQLSEIEQSTKIASKGKQDLKNGDQRGPGRGRNQKRGVGSRSALKGKPCSLVSHLTFSSSEPSQASLGTRLQWWENKHPFFQLLNKNKTTFLSIIPRELILGHAPFQLRCSDFCVPKAHSLCDRYCRIPDKAEQDPPEPNPASWPSFPSHSALLYIPLWLGPVLGQVCICGSLCLFLCSTAHFWSLAYIFAVFAQGDWKSHLSFL